MGFKGSNKDGQRKAMFGRLQGSNKFKTMPTVVMSRTVRKNLIMAQSTDLLKKNLKVGHMSKDTELFVKKVISDRQSNKSKVYQTKSFVEAVAVKENMDNLHKKLGERNRAKIVKDGISFKVIDTDNSYSQLKKKGVNLSPVKDFDGDGVRNSKDCKPLDPKKQGFIHDVQMRLLKAREESVERKKEKELKKLEDLKDRLEVSRSIKAKSNEIQKAKLQAKQEVVDETNRERMELQKLKDANLRAKQELFEGSPLGKTVRFSSKAISDTQSFLKKKSTQDSIKRFNKLLSGSPVKRSVKRKVKKKVVKKKSKRKVKKSSSDSWY